MWVRTENSSSVKPQSVEYGQTHARFRKNFISRNAEYDEDGHQTRPARWEYDEEAVPNEQLAAYEKARANDQAIDDIVIAMIEG